MTPDGFPLAYEVMSGNTKDSNTLEEFLEKIEGQYGRANRTNVKLLNEEGELYILVESADRLNKERSMRRRKLKKLWNRLKQLQQQRNSRDKLLLKIGAARKDAGRAYSLVDIHNMVLTEIEQAFKELKSDLSIRPIYHQEDKRIDAHIFIAFQAYCLNVTLKHRLKALAPGLTQRSVIEQFKKIQMVDVYLPTTDGRRLKLSRYTQPEKEHNILLNRLKLYYHRSLHHKLHRK